MRRFKKRTLSLITLAVIIGGMALLYFAINTHPVQKSILELLSKGDLKFSASSIQFKVFTNRIAAKDLKITNNKTGLDVTFDSTKIRYSLLGFLRGKIVFPNISIVGSNIVLPTTPDENEKKKSVSIKKLLLLKNLEIRDSSIEQASIIFPGGTVIVTDTLGFEFKPKLTGEVKIKLGLQGATIKGKKTDIAIGAIYLDGETNIEKWHDVPPYANAIKGRLSVSDFKSGDFEIAKFLTKIELNDKKIKTTDFEVSNNGGLMTGLFEIDLQKKSYKANIEIPKPLSLPHLETKKYVMDPEGEITGEIHAEGSGFSPNEINLKLSANLTHNKKDLAPLVVNSNMEWINGVGTFKDTIVHIGDGTASVEGYIDISKKHMDMHYIGKDVDMKAFFGRFAEPSIRPFFGIADADVKFVGWAKDFTVTGPANTTGRSGFARIYAGRLDAILDINYQAVKITGTISQDEKETGDVSVIIEHGNRREDGTREKTLHIKATLKDHDLLPSFEEYQLSGKGTAEFQLDGPPEAFKSKLTATITDGAFMGMVFDSVSTEINISRGEMKILNGVLNFPNVEEIVFNEPIIMDFYPGGFRMYGKPTDNLEFDTKMDKKTGDWDISKINYKDLSVKGHFSPKGTNNLQIKGSIDSNKLAIYKTFLREASGPVRMDLKFTNTFLDPVVYGSILLNNNTVYPRAIRQRTENVMGEIKFDGRIIRTDSLTGSTEDGSFLIKGFFAHDKLRPKKFDIYIDGHNLRYATPDYTYKMEFDAELNIKGNDQSSKIKGEIAILDGRYTKDFTILEGLEKKPVKGKEISLFANENLKLDLYIHNTGDLAIRNNIGDIWMKADINVVGNAKKPQVSGLVETTEGKIHYMNRDFTVTRGFVEFHDPYTNPYLEIVAEHEVPTITDLVVIATLHGRISNLKLDLSSTKGLERRDIVSLLIFGVTESEMKQAQWSSGLAPSVVASQVTHLIERPITEFSRLDIFRLEAAGGPSNSSNASPTSTQISRMYLGKKITDRLSLEFVTDINTEETQQTIRGEYMLTDFLILKGERSSGQKYKLNVSLRFRVR